MRPMNRLIRISSGKILFASDLQGVLYDFEQVLLKYAELRREGEADFLVFGGDVIHAYPGYDDDSLHLLERLMSISEEDPSIIYLMGNHELAHVLHWRLRKGQLDFTEELESRMGGAREEFIRFLSDRPFGLMTRGGVMMLHTGPSELLGSLKLNEEADLELWDWFWNVDFHKTLPNGPTPLQVFDPEFGRKLLTYRHGRILWEAFMNKNEYQYDDYSNILRRYLANFQGLVSYLVSGHIPVSSGAKNLYERQLRICSGYGAIDDSRKKLLLVEADMIYESLGALQSGLIRLFG